MSAMNLPNSPHRYRVAPPLKRVGYTGPRTHATNAQRQELRRWFYDNSTGKKKHEDALVWWKAKYGTEIKRSTLSDTLSAKFSHLDKLELSTHTSLVLKARECRWPKLEAALIEWQIRYDRHPDSGNTTGDMLRYKATEFWGKLLQYASQPCPKWTNGWLANFKKYII
jgi:hypothetical protein